jgi:hypothetical protein
MVDEVAQVPVVGRVHLQENKERHFNPISISLDHLLNFANLLRDGSVLACC